MKVTRDQFDEVIFLVGVAIVVIAFAAFMSGCKAGGKSVPSKPAIHAAVENVKDADDHLASAEKNLRKEPPAVTTAQKEIGSARDQLTYAQGDLSKAVKSSSENDRKAAKWDEVQDDWLGPRTVAWLWLTCMLIVFGTILRFSGLAFVGPVGAILSRAGSFLLAIGTMGLTAIKWIAEEVWGWISKRAAKKATSESGVAK